VRDLSTLQAPLDELLKKSQATLDGRDARVDGADRLR
jgi:hypothetical protein